MGGEESGEATAQWQQRQRQPVRTGAIHLPSPEPPGGPTHRGRGCARDGLAVGPRSPRGRDHFKTGKPSATCSSTTFPPPLHFRLLVTSPEGAEVPPPARAQQPLPTPVRALTAASARVSLLFRKLTAEEAHGRCRLRFWRTRPSGAGRSDTARWLSEVGAGRGRPGPRCLQAAPFVVEVTGRRKAASTPALRRWEPS